MSEDPLPDIPYGRILTGLRVAPLDTSIVMPSRWQGLQGRIKSDLRYEYEFTQCKEMAR